MTRRSPQVLLFSPLRRAFFSPLLALLLLAAPHLHAAEEYLGEITTQAYELLEKVGDREHIPRLLTTDDLKVSMIRPESLQPVFGDFDKDGKRDAAIAGVYNLPKKGLPYFLLVAGDIDGKPRRIYAEDGASPFYLHAPGITGNGDPGDQAFAMSLCFNCEKGLDFYWNARERRFRKVAWKPGRDVTTQVVKTSTAAEVSDENIDKALKVAGALPDVREYVAGVKKRNGKLGTRVEAVEGSTDRVRVRVFEKLAGGEELYDAIEVDLPTETVVGREKP